MRRSAALATVVAVLLLGALPGSAEAQEYTPKRINKAIELWEMGEPVYYLQVSGGGYEAGLALAQTHADAVGYNVEQAPFNAGDLRAFIQGLIDGGPTPSGHRTPAVIVTLPVVGFDEATVRANHWMVEQSLTAGAHGVFLVHAKSRGAVRAFVEAARYHMAPPFEGIGQGMRGTGGQGLAAAMWGISAAEYLQRGDVWPINPNGEIIIGIKTETADVLDRLDEMISVPGVSFVEWGPNDMSNSLGLPRQAGAPFAQPVLDARRQVLEAAHRHNVVFMDVFTTPANLPERVDEERILFHFADEAVARFGREHTGRTMPY
jgi:4-hydroxy-2-oxoheptanedioate aldolase